MVHCWMFYNNQSWSCKVETVLGTIQRSWGSLWFLCFMVCYCKSCYGRKHAHCAVDQSDGIYNTYCQVTNNNNNIIILSKSYKNYWRKRKSDMQFHNSANSSMAVNEWRLLRLGPCKLNFSFLPHQSQMYLNTSGRQRWVKVREEGGS